MTWIDQMAKDEEVKFICTKCNEAIFVRMNIVMQLEAMKDMNKIIPPQMRCKKCGHPMIPEVYTGINGVVYTFEEYKDLV